MKKTAILSAALVLSLLGGCGAAAETSDSAVGSGSASVWGDAQTATTEAAETVTATPSQKPSPVPSQTTLAPAETEEPEPEATPEAAESPEPTPTPTPTPTPEPDHSEEEALGGLTDGALPPTDAPALITVLSPEASGERTEESGSAVIDYSHAEDGYVMVAWLAGGDARVKVLITGPSGTRYQYNLRLDGDYETFPLSDGSGSYNVGVFRNTSGTSYATVLGADLYVELTDEFAPFLRPNQYITFSEDSLAVQKAAELCAGLTDNLDKVKAVYEYVVDHVAYDDAKAESVQSGYLPDVDETLETGKGICFDYAALMTAMLRSQEVPTKLIVGYTGEVYHAWINVYSETDGWVDAAIYFNGREWKLMDPTFASNAGRSDAIMSYIGNGSNYTAKYQY